MLGDGAGVGKGRTIAGIIYENVLHKRNKAIWLSISSDLIVDAQRDLNDVGIDRSFKIANLKDSDYKSIKLSSGVLFATYMSLIASKRRPTVNEFPTRIDQIINWVGGANFDGVIVFDESHKAKNLCPEVGNKSTKCGMAVASLQDRLPKARIVYASATGASDSKNMAYMTRLGLWGSDSSPFKTQPEFSDFIGVCIFVLFLPTVHFKSDVQFFFSKYNDLE